MAGTEDSLQWYADARDDTATDSQRHAHVFQPNAGAQLAGASSHGDRPNYAEWTVVRLRKECKDRGLTVKDRTKKDGLVLLLRGHDEAGPSRLAALGRAASREPMRTRHCIFRLLNLLFSDEFSLRFSQSGNTPSRYELDAGGNPRMRLWEEVADAFREECEDCNNLIEDDGMFVDVNPSIIVPHSADKLRSMWKDTNSEFLKATARCQRSGSHATFRNFVQGRAGVLYLWYWLQVKPQLTSFTLGGLLEEHQIDSLHQQLVMIHPANHDTPPPKSKVTGKRKSAGTPLSPRSRRQKTKQDANTAIEQLAASVSLYLAQIRAGATNETQIPREANRSAGFRRLDDLRAKIGGIVRDLKDAEGDDKIRLEEDRLFYMNERKRVMQELAKDE